jgi:hypothetical protein
MITARSITGDESTILLALCGIAATLIRVHYLRNRGLEMITRPNVRRRDRRRLGRGQYPTQDPVTATAVGAAATATITFSKAVLVSGPLPLVVGTKTFVSQVVSSPTQVIVTMNGAVTGLDYSMVANPATVVGQKGEPVAALAGTFP